MFKRMFTKRDIARFCRQTASRYFATSFLLLLVGFMSIRMHWYNNYNSDEELIIGGKDSYKKRHILSEANEEIDLTKRDNIGTSTAFRSLITSQKVITVKNDKAWVQLTVPKSSQRQQLKKEISKKYIRRKNVLKASCRKQRSDVMHWSDTTQMIAAPQQHIAACFVQKAGSTSWHKLIYNLRNHGAKKWTNEGHVENREYTKRLPGHVKSVLLRSPDVTRVLCVRHPFARLISGWNSKFHKSFVTTVGNLMFKSMPELIDYVGMTSPPDADHVIAFEDFAQYVADHGIEKVDIHFKTVEQLCKPCGFPYDYIVKAESAIDDLWWVLNRFNASMENFLVHDVDFGRQDRESDIYKETLQNRNLTVQQQQVEIFSDIVRHFFKRIPRETTRKLMSIYYDDFVRYGYTFDVLSLSAGGFE